MYWLVIKPTTLTVAININNLCFSKSNHLKYVQNLASVNGMRTPFEVRNYNCHIQVGSTPSQHETSTQG